MSAVPLANAADSIHQLLLHLSVVGCSINERRQLHVLAAREVVAF